MPKRLGKFELPNKLTKVEEGSSPTYAKFIAEPFEAGYGHTVGNSLRRVLLSSIEGAAISSIKIEGVQHEFQSIEGVVEDVTDIVLNLKKILIVSQKREPVTLAIKANREGPVTAADIQPDPAIQIVNPDQLICTLDKNARVRGRDRDQDRPRLLPGRGKQEGRPGRSASSRSIPSSARSASSGTRSRTPASARSPTTTSSSSRSGPTAASRRTTPSSSPPRSSSTTSTCSTASARSTTSSRASRARSARRRTSSASCSTCRSTRSSSPSAPPTA